MNKIKGLIYLNEVLNTRGKFITHTELAANIVELCGIIGTPVEVHSEVDENIVKHIVSMKDGMVSVSFESEVLSNRYFNGGWINALLTVYSILAYRKNKISLTDLSETELETYMSVTMRPFYAHNDKAHKYEHVKNVISTTKDMINYTARDYHDNLVIVAGYAHDMYSSVNRVEHHSAAGEYIRNLDINILHWIMTDEEIKLVSDAVSEHRASFKGTYSSEFSECFASGDRGVPDLDVIIRRCYQSAAKMSNNFKELNNDEIKNCSEKNRAFVKTLIHLQNKFATKGYARYPIMYTGYYFEELEVVREWCDTVTPMKLQNKLEELKLI